MVQEEAMLTQLRITVITLSGATLAFAQTTTTPAPTTTAPPATTTATPSANRPPATSTQPTQPSSQPQRPTQPVFISGNVLLTDGTEPPDRVLIERVCSNNKVRSEGYTDSKGYFSLQLGQSLQIMSDASEITLLDGTQGLGNNVTPSTSQGSPDPYFDCELRGRLAGYRSSTISLAGRRSMDNPGVGTLVLYPISKSDGQAISATSATASKDARKAFDKGLNEFRKQKFDSAEKEFRKAVDLHPKYSEAWLQLSRTYSSLKRLPEAREAVTKAIAADPQFVYPYEQLYKIAFEETKWQELADTTDRLLRLNPYEFPIAYYFNGVAHYELKNYDAAQKMLQQAIDADRRNSNPKAHYVLGLVLIQKHDYPAAAQSLITFTNLAPNDAQIPKTRAILEQIEKATR
jgi:tetratricopeptide (TPR) repeat protein